MITALVRHRGWLVVMATALSLAAAGPLAAQGPTGKLEGVVRDSATAEGLANAQVFIVGTAFMAVADTSGYYFINGIPAGSHDVRARWVGYRAMELRGVRIRSGHTATQNFTLTQADTSPIPVIAVNRLPPGQHHREHVLIEGQYTDRVPESPTSGRGVVHGTIRDERHRPIADARVTIVGTELVTTADSLGRFRFEAVPAGNYDLRAAFPGHKATEIRGLRVMSRQTVTQDVSLGKVQ